MYECPFCFVVSRMLSQRSYLKITLLIQLVLLTDPITMFHLLFPKNRLHQMKKESIKCFVFRLSEFLYNYQDYNLLLMSVDK